MQSRISCIDSVSPSRLALIGGKIFAISFCLDDLTDASDNDWTREISIVFKNLNLNLRIVFEQDTEK